MSDFRFIFSIAYYYRNINIAFQKTIASRFSFSTSALSHLFTLHQNTGNNWDIPARWRHRSSALSPVLPEEKHAGWGRSRTVAYITIIICVPRKKKRAARNSSPEPVSSGLLVHSLLESLADLESCNRCRCNLDDLAGLRVLCCTFVSLL